ncbi:hypothetical protein D8S78_15890 [Natrialba swarupiae]|nr:hypothetical protein [Natrialba swarupiae]
MAIECASQSETITDEAVRTFGLEAYIDRKSSSETTCTAPFALLAIQNARPSSILQRKRSSNLLDWLGNGLNKTIRTGTGGTESPSRT